MNGEVREVARILRSHWKSRNQRVSWWIVRPIESKGVLITLKIDELIRKQCPQGVESVKVGDIAEVGTGKRDRKEEDPTGKYPLYVRSKDVLRINEYDYDETAIITPGEGKVGEVFHFIEGKYALHARAYRVSVRDNRILPKFLLYAFEHGFKNFLDSRVYTGTLNSIRMPMVKDFQVPAPPY